MVARYDYLMLIGQTSQEGSKFLELFLPRCTSEVTSVYEDVSLGPITCLQ